MSFEIKPKITIKQKPKNECKSPKKGMDKTLQGVLLNNRIKNCSQNFDNFDKISSSLLIPEKIEQEKKKEEKESFNYKNILKPLAITTIAGLGALCGISFCMLKYSKNIADKNDIVRPADLARNINIVEEPHFAMYRALRDPNTKNILGLGAVVLMSAVTLIAKNFTDGFREIWVKKQSCDIERDFQENLIQVETEAFSGKLKVVNNLLVEKSNYFKNALKNNPNFKGNNKKEENKNNKKLILTGAAGIFAISALGVLVFKNYQKTAKNLNIFVKKIEDKEIREKIERAINEENKSDAIEQLTGILKMINAKSETIKENFAKIKGITEDEIERAQKEIQNAQIYAKAPEALGGISEKIQYYCYINEERGHLYNWVLNPENKFNKYLFLTFCAISATGYIAKLAADAIREVAVKKENTKSELELKKRLVAVEIDNFKAKKMSAIAPLIENFDSQLKKGKSQDELEQIAQNILFEIKNGPPYVYS